MFDNNLKENKSLIERLYGGCRHINKHCTTCLGAPLNCIPGSCKKNTEWKELNATQRFWVSWAQKQNWESGRMPKDIPACCIEEAKKYSKVYKEALKRHLKEVEDNEIL
jgi:hypothetical protein